MLHISWRCRRYYKSTSILLLFFIFSWQQCYAGYQPDIGWFSTIRKPCNIARPRAVFLLRAIINRYSARFQVPIFACRQKEIPTPMFPLAATSVCYLFYLSCTFWLNILLLTRSMHLSRSVGLVLVSQQILTAAYSRRHTGATSIFLEDLAKRAPTKYHALMHRVFLQVRSVLFLFLTSPVSPVISNKTNGASKDSDQFSSVFDLSRMADEWPVFLTDHIVDFYIRYYVYFLRFWMASVKFYQGFRAGFLKNNNHYLLKFGRNLSIKYRSPDILMKLKNYLGRLGLSAKLIFLYFSVFKYIWQTWNSL